MATKRPAPAFQEVSLRIAADDYAFAQKQSAEHVSLDASEFLAGILHREIGALRLEASDPRSASEKRLQARLDREEQKTGLLRELLFESMAHGAQLEEHLRTARRHIAARGITIAADDDGIPF
jgi:hypothetical protein